MPWELAGLSASSFVLVFLMGPQTKNVVHSRYVGAFLTSLGINAMHLVFIRAAATDDFLTVVLFAGVPSAVGICCSIFIHDIFHRRTARG